jgi:hypothetical protein
MKHKHAELIKAWADGAEIQVKAFSHSDWEDVDMNGEEWYEHYTYRIKPMPKPDLCKYVVVEAIDDGFTKWHTCSPAHANLHLTFDGETKQLKSAEVL